MHLLDDFITKRIIAFFFRQKGFFLHCREWDELLNRKEWVPKKIIEKLPDFFRLVKNVQSLVLARTG